MHAYMNAESLRLTRETGEVHFFSRSRQELWHKGETSGNTLAVKAIRYDCDGDALLALVEPAGPACHTGERSCFHRGELEPAGPTKRFPTLERTISARAAERPGGSYTAELLADRTLNGDKVIEEAEEIVRAARDESDERVAEEAADVIYHLAVLLRARGLVWPTPSGYSMAVASGKAVAADAAIASRHRSKRRARSRATTTSSPSAETFIEDCETPVSAFLKLRGRARAGVPARVRGAGTRGALLVHRLSPSQGAAAGRSAIPAIPYALAAEELRGFGPAPLEGLPPFAGGAVGMFAYDLVRTVEPLGEPNPDPLGLPDLALMLTDALVVFDHLKRTITVLANAYVDDDLETSYRQALETIAAVRRRLAAPVPSPGRCRKRAGPQGPAI